MRVAVGTLIGLLVFFLTVTPISCGKTDSLPSLPDKKPNPEITLADSSTILDLSSSLPSSFRHLGHGEADSEGLSNRAIGYETYWSETEIFFSESPYQLVLAILTIIESPIERAATDAVIRDAEQVESMAVAGLSSVLAMDGLYPSGIDADVTYPNIGDLAARVYVDYSVSGITSGFEMVWFKVGKIYIYLESDFLSAERVSLVQPAQEIVCHIEVIQK